MQSKQLHIEPQPCLHGLFTITVEQLTKIPLGFYRHSTLSINTCQTKRPLNGKCYISAFSLCSLIKYFAFQLCTLAHFCEDHGQI